MVLRVTIASQEDHFKEQEVDSESKENNFSSFPLLLGYDV